MQRGSRKSLLACGLVGCAVAFAGLVVAAAIAFFVDQATDDAGRNGTVARERPRPRRQAPERPASHPSASPEPSQWAPDPLYPTPEAAGTQAVYLLEEPERGPLVTEAPEARPELEWSDESYCEVGWGGVACAGIEGSDRGNDRFRRGHATGYERVEHWIGDSRQEAWATSFGADGRPLQMVAFDAHGEILWARSYRENATEVTARAPNGANILEGCGLLRLSWEDRQVKQVTCEQWGGGPMANRSAVVTSVFEHDPAAFLVEERTLDANDRPIESSDGVHRETIRRDRFGRVIERSRFAIDGAPVSSLADGCHSEEFLRDESGVVVEWRCLDREGNPHPGRGPVAARRYEHDEDGCLVAMTLWEADGEPVEECVGLHRMEWEMAEPCVRSSVVCRNRSGDEVRCAPGEPPRTEWTRDERGRVVSARHFAAGQPAGDPEYGVFEVRSIWDDRGNVIEIACFDPRGEPVDCGRTGFHARISTFDDAGREIETRFRARDGGVGSNHGTVRRIYIYDAYDHQVESHDLDAAGDPIALLGASRREDLWTHGHRLFAVRLWAPDGSPARFDGCYSGHRCPTIPWHAVRVVRTETGAVQENLFFDHQGQLIGTFSCLRSQCFQ